MRLELLKFDADEAQEAFWRSSAHLLGAALESPLPLWGCRFARRRLEISARLSVGFMAAVEPLSGLEILLQVLLWQVLA